MKWWTGKIVAIGNKQKIQSKLDDYESQLPHTKNPTLHQTFVEDLISSSNDGDSDYDVHSEENNTPVSDKSKNAKPSLKVSVSIITFVELLCAALERLVDIFFSFRQIVCREKERGKLTKRELEVPPFSQPEENTL